MEPYLERSDPRIDCCRCGFRKHHFAMEMDHFDCGNGSRLFCRLPKNEKESGFIHRSSNRLPGSARDSFLAEGWDYLISAARAMPSSLSFALLPCLLPQAF